MAPEEISRKPKTRANGEGSVFKLSDGRWRATKTAGFNSDGKQKIIAGSGGTREIAIERRETSWRKWLVSTGQAPMSVLKKSTVEESMMVGDWFYAWHAAFDKSRTKEHYRKQVLSRIELHINPAFGKTPLLLLSAADIETWVRVTMPAKTKASGEPLLTYGTISNIFSTFRLGLSVAMKKGHIATNPALMVDPPLKQKTKPQVDRKKWVPLHLLKHLEGHEWETFYLLKMLYGLRVSEVLGLTDESFLLSSKKPRLIISTQLKRHDVVHGCGKRASDKSFPCGKKTARTCPKVIGTPGWYLDSPKSEAGIRTLPLVEPALTAVKAHLKKQKALRLLPDYTSKKGLERLFFTSPTGGPVFPQVANTHWHNLLNDAKVDYLRGHEMRHISATLLAEAGVPLETIKLILGHSSAAMSAHYVSMGNASTLEPLENLGAHITQRTTRAKAMEGS